MLHTGVFITHTVGEDWGVEGGRGGAGCQICFALIDVPFFVITGFTVKCWSKNFTPSKRDESVSLVL